MILHGVYIYSIDPLVLSVSDNFVSILMRLMPAHIQAKAYFLVFPTWTKESWKKCLSTAWHLRSLPKARTVFMCSTPKEREHLKWAGFKTEWCHQNLFCNEDEFFVQESVERYFDAVYNAVLAPYKRHELLVGVRSLRLITGSVDKVHLLPKMGLSGVVINDRYLSKREIAEVFGGCKCGLALSKEEGGMLACTEYLLSGLPVVSTPSIGGRHIYYNKLNHIICEDSVNAVCDAVVMAAARDWDRSLIRIEAIKVQKMFRSALAKVVREISGLEPFNSMEITGSWFKERFLSIHFMREFFESSTGHGFSRMDLLGRNK